MAEELSGIRASAPVPQSRMFRGEDGDFFAGIGCAGMVDRAP
jgi:hypothetical protein